MQESASIRFKKRLKALRLARGWTQERAAEACGMGYKLYQLYELGIRNNPGLVNIEKIASGYGLDVSELLSPNFPKLKLQKSLRKKAT